MMRTSFSAAALAVCVVLLTSASPAFARNSILSDWEGLYPGSQTDNNLSDTCTLCHGGADRGTWNPYGWAIRDLITNAGQTAVQAILNVEPENSDLDPTGATNLEEITADSPPGWTDGNTNTIFVKDGTILTNQPPAALLAGAYDPPAANIPPTANAGGPYTATVGVPVTFDGTGSFDPDGTIVFYDWAFGDGTVALDAGPTPQHTYTADGTFNVVLTVTDNAGDTGVDTTQASTGAGNQPPIANPGGPYTGTVGVAVQFDGTGSSDPDGTIVSYDWNFGDGNVGTGPTPTHTYAAQGTYNVTLTVTDDAAATGSNPTTATIGAAGNIPPTADAGGPYTGEAQVPLFFNGTGSFDPDGSIISYSWDYGDGGKGTGPTPFHTYFRDGLYTVKLTVTDNRGATGTDTTSAAIGVVPNLPPVANAGGPYTGTAGSPVSFDGTGSSDPDGTIASYDWDFGDGTVIPNAGPTPSHTYDVAGTYAVTLTVTDNQGAADSATASATIGVGNLPPVADPNGPYSGTVGVAIQFDGSNSSDPDGTIAFYDWDFGDGTVALNAGPTPTHAYAAAGIFNVTLTVTDNAAATGSAMTTATVSPPGELNIDPIRLAVDNKASVSRGRPIEIQLTVKNVGSVQGTAPATVIGEQNGNVIYNETLPVTDLPGDGRVRVDFPPYTPIFAGDILWTATVADDIPTDVDEVMATTRVVP